MGNLHRRFVGLVATALVAVAALFAPSAFAQGQGGGAPVYQNWFPVGTPATLSVSSVTANVALPTGGLTARVCNTGATDAYVVLGTANSVVATTAAGSFLASGKCQPFNLLPFATRYTYIAAITASSTTTIRVESGLGSPIASDGSSSGSAPSGAAGGDLSGTYPNPTVTKASSGFALPSSALTFSGNITGAAIFGTNGIKVKTTSGTLSDTTSSGTVAANYNNLFGGNTQTATSATTITNNHGSYFTAPICSTNVTCTANWALGADSLVVGTSQGFTVSTAGGLTAAGISSSNGRLSVSGSRSQGAWGTSGVSSINSGSTLTDSSSSGTVAVQYAFALKAPTIAANSSTTFTNSYNTYVENPVAGTNVTQTSAWALGADSLFDAGKLGLASGSIVSWNADTGLSRDSVLGALNLDLGNGTANDKSGTLNLLHVALSSYATMQAIRDTTASQAIDLTTSNYVDILGAHPNLRTLGALVAGGAAPTASGTCTRGAQTGGNTTGTIVLTCTAQTLILTFTTTAPTGWMCEAIDQTTTADTMKQTSNTTTSCTLTGTTAASDVIIFQARAY